MELLMTILYPNIAEFKKHFGAIKIFIGLSLILLSCSEKSPNPIFINYPPYVPVALTPIDNSQNNKTNVTLIWECTDSEGDSLRYDIYFGDIAEPPLADTGLVQAAYDPGYLEYSTTYFWRVVAIDRSNSRTDGILWSFKTGPMSGIQLAGLCELPITPFGQDWINMVADENYLYLIFDIRSLFIFDISDPSNPHFVSRYETENYIGQIALRDQMIYMAEDGLGLEVVDVSNPTNPVRAYTYVYPEMGDTWGMAMRSNYAYLGGTNKIITFDISNPAGPTPVDYAYPQKLDS
jgi:hypothetical protein